MKRILNDPLNEVPFEGLGAFTSEFKVSRQEELVTLYSALEKSDFHSIERVAHTWKGFAVPYGFGELAILATELEEACEQKNIEQCRDLLKETESYLSTK